MANHSDPESCGYDREVVLEALTGETDRPVIEPRNQSFGMPTLSIEAEGNMVHSDNRKRCTDPTRSETLCMSGSLSYGSSEISMVSGGVWPDGAGKVKDRNPAINAIEKSDTPIVPKKWPNKEEEFSTETMEERGVARRNVAKSPASQTQSCDGLNKNHVSKGLDGIREIAKANKQLRFTALLHHVTPSLLVESFYALRKAAAAGVDEVTWHDYQDLLYTRVHELHCEIQAGRYRVQASRRVYIEKADGKMRALGIAALEDKIVQQALVSVLNAIYEQDFLGFSYGFRQGRSQHDALDALAIGIVDRDIHWIIDADIRAFFDEIDHEWMMKFLSHRIADQRVLRLIGKWLKAGVIEDGRRVAAERGTPQGAVISPLLANIYLHYAYDLWAHQWRTRHAAGDVILIRYADDNVMGFQYEAEAQRFLAALHERLAHFKLALHPDKTRLIRFGRYALQQSAKRGEGKPKSFDFLGFTHCCGRTRNGQRFKLVRLTIKKRMRATLTAIRQKLMRRRHEAVPVIGKWLASVVRGYLNYFAVPGNMGRLDGFIKEVNRAWRFALMRRSQRNRMTWARFRGLVIKYIPKCRVVHPYPSERFYVNTAGRSRMQ